MTPEIVHPVLYGDADIVLSDGHGFISCFDCGRWVKDVYRYNLPDKVLGLCLRCYDLRKKIEDRVLELTCPGATGQTILEALEPLGLTKELIEETVISLIAGGRLACTKPPSGGGT